MGIVVRKAVLLAMAAISTAGAQMKYPPAARGSQFEDLSGIRVPDPYRWLESQGSPEVRAWTAAQNTLTESFFAQLPRRAEVAARLSRAASAARVSSPFSAGERMFFYENAGLENQPALYVQDRHDTPPRVLIDPNVFSKDGLIAIVGEAASPDGRYLAYAVSTQGSSWKTVRVRDVRTSQDLEEELHGIKDSTLAWTRDSRGFFYFRLDSAKTSTPNAIAPDGRQRLFYHRVGRPQSDDQVVYENREHPDWQVGARVSEDGQYLVLSLRAPTDTKNRLHFIDLDNPKKPNLSAPVVKLFDANDALYEFVASEGPLFFIRTSRGAPRTRVVAVDINAPDENHWVNVVRETYDPLVEARRVDDRIVAHRLHDVHSVLELYSLDGAQRGVISLPGVGTVTGISGRDDTREIFYTFSSYLMPPTVYRYDMETRTGTPFRDTRADSTLSSYESWQLIYTSKDGTRVPMWITVRRGITLSGSLPVLLEAEGAFGHYGTPRYSPLAAAWLQSGGIYAVANVRGGGEYGRMWHETGRASRKQTGVDDLIAAAEFLVNQRYTRAPLLGLVAHGGGALLAGAALVQRPELFGAAALDAGLFDLARYSRFTVGRMWASEFGAPENAADAKMMAAVSPVATVKSGAKLPTILLTVGDYDDVIPPVHSFKFAAALQSAQTAPAPILLRVEPDIGHGPGVPLTKRLAIDADRLAFLMNALKAR
jgi:prolyl oligopeptidase